MLRRFRLWKKRRELNHSIDMVKKAVKYLKKGAHENLFFLSDAEIESDLMNYALQKKKEWLKEIEDRVKGPWMNCIDFEEASETFSRLAKLMESSKDIQ